jgi:hypothetical protein
MSRSNAPVAVASTCLVAGLAYSGAVTGLALLAFVLPGVLLAAASSTAVARLSTWGGLLAGGAVALVWGEVVNLVSGNGNGPAARSTFAAALFTAVAVAAGAGPAPACFLLGVVGVLAGALALGAGAEVGPVAVATAVVAVVALAVVARAREAWGERPPGRLVVVLLALVVGAAVAAVVVVADRQTTADPAVLSAGAVDDSIRPPGFLELPTPTPTPAGTQVADQQAPVPTGQAAEGAPDASRSPFWWLLALLVVVVLAVPVRLAWVALAWRRLRRRLRRGSPVERVGGAWVWARRRIVATGLELPSNLSPDAVAAGRGTSALPRSVRPALVRLARATEVAMFAPSDGPTEAELTSAWEAADLAAGEAVGSLRVGRRAIMALRPLSSTPSRPTRRSEDLVEMRS